MGLLHELRSRFPLNGGRAGRAQPAAGVYHYLRETPESKARLHLRLAADGHGVLMVNASRVYHLNPTAAWLAYLALEEVDRKEAVRLMTRRYAVKPDQAGQDYDAFMEQFTGWHRQRPAQSELELETTAPFSDRRPRRTGWIWHHLPLQQRLRPVTTPGRTSTPIDDRTVVSILDRLWEIGIPHIVFTAKTNTPTCRS